MQGEGKLSEKFRHADLQNMLGDGEVGARERKGAGKPGYCEGDPGRKNAVERRRCRICHHKMLLEAS